MNNFQEKALYVGEMEDDIDLNEPPTTGEEYIKRVVLEAKMCQDVVVAPVEEIKLKQRTAIELSGSNNTPNYLMTTKEWQDIQVKDFSDIRLYIAQLRSRKELISQMTKNVYVPNIDDEKAWLRLCSGGENNTTYLWPKLNTVLSLSQMMIERVLEYLITYVQNQNKISHNIGRWIYTLLVLLELPLNPDTVSSLRLLARCCLHLRINLNSVEAPEINIHNLFICLVAKYFRQLDLADQ